ncbi:hypothetical protein DFH07DRAFT_836699 [Mycena maculata]|uniref:Uncharacterized protein n=1 Tax=Mycena maculata TaxID=230809 RepID=A0AAD7IG53_9AGAR|nr:hypothetical protein DFH07DRAFT_836699 [Mycena maculata]
MPEPGRRRRIQMAGYVLLRPQMRVRPTGDSRARSVHCTAPLTDGTRILGSKYGVPEEESQERKTHPRQCPQASSVLLSLSLSLSRPFDNSSSAIGVSPCPRPTRAYSAARAPSRQIHTLVDVLLPHTSIRRPYPYGTRPRSAYSIPACFCSCVLTSSRQIPTASVSHTNPGVPLRTLCGTARTRTHPWGRISLYPAADHGLPFVRTRNSTFK